MIFLFFLLSLVMTYEDKNIEIVYMWIGPNPMPIQYKTKLKSLQYPWRLVLDCQILIQNMEEELGYRYKHKDMEYNKKADLCRYIYLYRYGGAYSDLDIDLNYKCFLEQVKNNKDDFIYSADVYFMYERKPGSPRMREILENFDQKHQVLGYHYPDGFGSGSSIKVNECLFHHADESWVPKDKYKTLKIVLLVFLTVTFLGGGVYYYLKKIKNKNNSKLQNIGSIQTSAI